MARGDQRLARKPLLSVEETAILLGQSRSSIYRAIDRGDLPLPVLVISGRRRVPRRAVERLLEGDVPAGEEGVVKGAGAGEGSGGTIDDPGDQPGGSGHGDDRPPAAGLAPSPRWRRRSPMCSAARRSSAGTPSV
ncbi:MAG TPA: helix-turn-helix domain-containing protein [Acidimicrobiales bacterium]|nr:helix-turn-helix domain-containing protein [Acidimicrobiales bacterium]